MHYIIRDISNHLCDLEKVAVNSCGAFESTMSRPRGGEHRERLGEEVRAQFLKQRGYRYENPIPIRFALPQDQKRLHVLSIVMEAKLLGITFHLGNAGKKAQLQHRMGGTPQ